MARGGIYKAEVVRARTKLQSMGVNPSIDAIRQELGNTGSKTTINRFLKEIEEEEGGKSGGKVAISEALQDLVARLAERLVQEGDSRIAEMAAKHAEEIEKLQQTLGETQAHNSALESELLEATSEVVTEQKNHERSAAHFQHERLTLAQVRQLATDMEARIAELEAHRQSLEEKHTHAREALDHFRTAAKEQREQEQQTQYLQGEIKALKTSVTQAQLESANANKENAHLVGELSKAERSLHDAKTELRELRGVKSELGAAQQQTERLGRQVAELTVQVENEQKRGLELNAGLTATASENQQLRVELAGARATLETQEQLSEQIKVWMTQQTQGEPRKVR